MVSDLLSGVLQTHWHYKRKPSAVILAKVVCMKYKRVPIIMANLFWRKAFIS